jgi:hypothetical protein
VWALEDSFNGVFELEKGHLAVINENNVNSASDYLVAQVAQLLLDHPRAGPEFLFSLLEESGSAAWCCRLLSPVLEQIHTGNRYRLQFSSVYSPYPYLFHLWQSARLWDPMLNVALFLQYCGNVDALSMLLQQFDADSRYDGRAALFGLHRSPKLSAHQHKELTRALLDAGANPRLLAGVEELPRVAILEAVFERVAPCTVFPTAADMLCPLAHGFEGPAVVLLLLKHGYRVSQV